MGKLDLNVMMIVQNEGNVVAINHLVYTIHLTKSYGKYAGKDKWNKMVSDSVGKKLP